MIINILVMIDVQKAFLNENTNWLPKEIGKLCMSPVFDEIIATQYINRPGSPCDRLCDWHDCYEGMKDAELDPVTNVASRVFKKTTYSCFTGEFQDYLAEKREQLKEGDKIVLYFAGISSTSCVLASAMSAFDNNIDFCVLKDMCYSTRGQVPNDEAIRNMEVNFGKNRVRRLSFDESAKAWINVLGAFD
jgi:nicotinamidase-related amidase